MDVGKFFRVRILRPNALRPAKVRNPRFVEMPAPVSATMCPDTAIQRHTVSMRWFAVLVYAAGAPDRRGAGHGLGGAHSGHDIERHQYAQQRDDHIRPYREVDGVPMRNFDRFEGT